MKLLRFRTLESRIVSLFLVLLLIGQGISFLVIRIGIHNNQKAAIHDQLELGTKLFSRLLNQKAEKLTSSARTVAKDYGFRQAIGTNDRETIESVLANTQERINASLTLFIGLDRKIKATTITEPTGNLETSIMALIDQAELNDGAVGISIFEHQPFQVLVVPVKAPVTIGYIAMAFPLDTKLASDMRDLSLLDTTFMVTEDGQRWEPNNSSMSKQDAANVSSQMPPTINNVAFSLDVDGSDYSARIVPLVVIGKQSAIVVLQSSVDAAVAPYRTLQVSLIVITGFVTLIAFLLSFFAARRIASPLRELTNVAKRLGDGDYDSPIEIKGDEEIHQLAIAFESMRNGIAKHEQQIRRLAYWDSLTDLPNRAQFSQLLGKAIEMCWRDRSSCYILMMDLDRFKNVNDVLGHRSGDALLTQVAQRLLQTVDSRYRVARLGGDEFAVLMPGADEQQARQTAACILLSLEAPLTLADQTVDLGASVGIVGCPVHGDESELLMSRAEVAMYCAKVSGNEAVLYDASIDKGSEESLSLLSELRRALEQNEFRMFVQPKLSLINGQFIGFESLVRWQHPERGMVFPDQFIPFAEKTGFIRSLTRWMLKQSAIMGGELMALGIEAKISVNISTRDLLDQHLPKMFIDLLESHHIPAKMFCLEITESAIMDDPVRALATLDKLHASGVELSIDDFGTGYSSLAYLKRLPVDELKIDKSFVMNMEFDADDAKIVRSTIDLGHNMGLRVVAEGIETQQVWQLLADMGCDQGQGYLMSRPIASHLLVDWIRAWSTRSTDF